MGLQLIRPDTNFDFMGKRKITTLISLIVIFAGIVSIFLKGGIRYGIDFAGGTLVQVKFSKEVDLSKLKSLLKREGIKSVVVQRFGEEKLNQYLFRIPLLNLEPEMIRSKIKNALKDLNIEFTIQRLEMVGPKVGSDLKNKAMEALFYAVLLISIYISGRFERKWGISASMAAGMAILLYILKSVGVPLSYLTLLTLILTLFLCWYLKLNYALGAVIALIHDVLVTVGIFSILNKEFDLTTVAALLTIIGYSLNDTIVVFDRIRENLKDKSKKEKEANFEKIINQSINQTLSRTILTSGTTLLVVLSLVLLGGGVIHDFALALFIGIVAGTYSSIFIASVLLLSTGPTPQKEKQEEAHQGA